MLTRSRPVSRTREPMQSGAHARVRAPQTHTHTVVTHTHNAHVRTHRRTDERTHARAKTRMSSRLRTRAHAKTDRLKVSEYGCRSGVVFHA
eukprot:14214930-Alexandrium_andersonii.AAC.1